MNPTLQASVLGLVRLFGPAAAGWLAGQFAGTTAAGWTTVISYAVSAGFSIYDKLGVGGKIQVAHATPPDQPLPANLR